ncbi:MAG: CPBP family intramembrane glutamic endopeptidase [Oscillochloridaceae bacterium umkhey_bin13]
MDNEVAPAVPWRWHEVGLVVLAAVVITAALALLARSVVEILGLGEQNSLVSPALYVVGTGFYLALIGAIYAFAVRRSGWAALGVIRTDLRNYTLVPILYIVALLSVAALNTLIGQLSGGFENPQIDALTGGQALDPRELLMLFLLAAVLVPIAEELFYRGLIYPLIRERFGSWLAISLSALLFAVTHFILILIPGLFVIGFLLAYLRERSGSIGPSIALHAMQNGLVVLSLNAILAAG